MDKKAVYQLTSGLYVLTARDGEKDNGCIVNTLLQVTSTPLTAVVAVNKQNYTHDMIQKTGLANVSLLTQEAPYALYQRFGFQSGKTADKFAGLQSVARSENGVLYLTQHAGAYLSLQVTDQKDLGTHTLFYMNITDAGVLSDAPSVTYAYYQKNVKPRPAAPTGGKTVWRCKICGYEYVGEELPADFICPICKHGAEDFEKIVSA